MIRMALCMITKSTILQPQCVCSGWHFPRSSTRQSSGLRQWMACTASRRTDRFGVAAVVRTECGRRAIPASGRARDHPPEQCEPRCEHVYCFYSNGQTVSDKYSMSRMRRPLASRSGANARGTNPHVSRSHWRINTVQDRMCPASSGKRPSDRSERCT